MEFSVEDFVPEKLKVELSTEGSILRTAQPTNFDLSADFLYGAPASGLTVESDLEGAVLIVEHIPAVVRCGVCDARSTLELPVLACSACGTTEVVLESGDEFMIQTIDVAWDPDIKQEHVEAVTKDNLTVAITGQIRWKPCERNLYAYLFGVKRPIVPTGPESPCRWSRVMKVTAVSTSSTST